MTNSPSIGSTRTISLPGGLSLNVQEFGQNTDGTGVLMLHGGAGPRSLVGFAAVMSQHSYVVVATHPGFDDTARPRWIASVDDLANIYLDLLDELDLKNVMVVGSSLGGWVAMETALRDNHRRIACLTLLGSVGITPDPPLKFANPAEIGLQKSGELAFYNPALRLDPAEFSEVQRAALAADQQTFAVYASSTFCHDPKLRGRVHRVTIPVLVIAGQSDGITPLAYQRALADAFPRATFRVIAEAGHFPHIEQPAEVFSVIGDFVDTEVSPTGE